MLFETIRLTFLACGFLLCLSCVLAANRMSSNTCNCQKSFFILILIGATFQMVLACESVMTGWGMLASIPISLGVSLKLIFDRRTQPCEPRYARDKS